MALSHESRQSEQPQEDILISIGPDGRVFFHDLDRTMIEVALRLNAKDPLMRRRLACTHKPRGKALKETENGSTKRAC